MNEIEIVVKSQDKSDLDKVAAKAKQAGREIGDGIQKGMGRAEDASGRGSKKIRDDLDNVRKAGDKAGDGLADSLGEALDGIASELSGALGNLGGALDSGISAAKGGAVAAGVGLAAFIFSGMQAEFAEDKVGGMLAAQTGAASSAAEDLGNTAGDVFGDNFGESIEEVGDAMKAVFENKLIDTGAAEADIKDVTERVMTLSQVTGESFNDISRDAQQMVRNGIAGSVTEAMDLIGEASQHGLNAADDLLDTIEEYSTKFRDLGLNGQQAFGLLEQAMDAGARDTDTAADALKEFAIRAQDSSVTTRRGFETIGLDADKMGKMIAAGGDSATSALRQTLNALQQMPPGVDRSTAAVDLFGTKAEDLGDALYSMDLDNAADKFENFGGTVDDMMKKLSDNTSFWDKLGRGISNAAGAVGEFLDFDVSDALEDLPELKDRIEEVSRAQREFDTTGNANALDELKKKYPEMADAIDKYVDKKRKEKGATDDATDSTKSYVETLDQMISKLQGIADPVLGLSDAQMGYQQSLDAATQALQDNGATLDIATEKGRENKAALDDVAKSSLDVADAMSQSGASVSDVNGFLGTARDQLIQTAISMGMSQAQAEAYANSLGLIPRTVLTNVELQANSAMENIAAYQRALDRIPRVITTTTQVRGSNITPGSGGHYYLSQAHGGIVGAEPAHAASGGVRSSSVMINDGAGIGELVELPNGSRVMTAGATRAMGEAGLLGGGGGPVVANFVIGGPTDELGRAIVNWLRNYVKNEYGGSVTGALGQRSGA